jgi:hypothetical protein
METPHEHDIDLVHQGFNSTEAYHLATLMCGHGITPAYEEALPINLANEKGRLEFPNFSCSPRNILMRTLLPVLLHSRYQMWNS